MPGNVNCRCGRRHGVHPALPGVPECWYLPEYPTAWPKVQPVRSAARHALVVEPRFQRVDAGLKLVIFSLQRLNRGQCHAAGVDG